MKSKALLRPFLAIVGLLAIWSCEKEILSEESNRPEGPSIQGLTLDPVCDAYQLPLADETGNLIVDFCNTQNTQVACPPGMPNWGSMMVYKTSQGFPLSSLYMEVQLAPGWFAQAYNVVVAPNGPIQTNGNLPVVNNDWRYDPLTPARNAFSISTPLLSSQYPSSCFDWAIEVEAIKYNLFGAVVPGSLQILRAYDANGSGSPFVVDRCYASCPIPDLTLTDGSCQGCRSQVTVTFHGCESVDVVSCKSIRQVVIVYDDCSRSYHDNLSGTSLSFPSNGKNISHVFVRSGCRANTGNPADDQIDTNGYSYPNVGRKRFDAHCLASGCN